jgi:hypothetical protein
MTFNRLINKLSILIPRKNTHIPEKAADQVFQHLIAVEHPYQCHGHRSGRHAHP